MSAQKTLLSEDFDRFSIVPGAKFPVKTAPAGSWAYAPMYSTRDGGSRVWQVGFDADTREVVTVYGKIGGKMQTSRAELTPMGKRNHSEQSVIAVTSKANVKMAKDGFAFPLEESALAILDSSVDRARPVPMLAKDFSALKRPLKFPVAVQPKLDGVRCMVDRLHNSDGVVVCRLTSRGGKDFNHLQPLFADEALWILASLPPDAVLDGELTVQRKDGVGCDFQGVTSAARTRTSITETARKDMRLLIFGLHLPSAPSATFEARAEMLRAAFEEASTWRSPLARLELVPHYKCDDMECLKRTHAEFVEAGEEGAMIYALDGVYSPNKRGDDLVKYKTFDEFEGEVIGVEPGKGRERNAAMVVIKCANGKIVKMHPEGAIAERERWLADPSIVVGKVMTYSCQGLTDSGVPRFPVAKCVRDYE